MNNEELETLIFALIVHRHKDLISFLDSIGLSMKAFADILRNGFDNSILEDVSKLCKGLNISIEELIKGNIVYHKYSVD